MSKDDIWDIVMMVGIVIVMVAFGHAVLDTTYHYDEERKAKPIVYSEQEPEIPECDKELWDRIREGCDDAIED